MELTLKLTRDEVQGLMNLLGELPTKSGVFPLAVKIKAQADEQVKAQETPKDKEKKP
jgi:hypothetical protein